MVPVTGITVNVEDCKPTTTNTTSNLLIIPSFGSTINETKTALVNNSQMAAGQSFNGNPSVFNGSCRLNKIINSVQGGSYEIFLTENLPD